MKILRESPLRALAVALCCAAAAPGARAQDLPPLAVSSGPLPGERRGASVCDAGDVDGDGVLDFWIGSPYDGTAGVQAGAVRAISGASGAVLHALHGRSAVDHFGWSIANVGDQDGDGVGELAVGAPDNDFQASGAGMVRVFSGRTGAHRFTALGSSTGAGFGWCVAPAGDANGDGVPDFCAGAPFDSTPAPGAGSVDVRSGNGGGLIARHPGLAAGDRLGIAVALAGDVDQDGRPDVLAGADLAGYALVFSGRTGATLRTLAGLAPHERFGCAVSGAHDVDGDLVPDLAVGASAAAAHARATGAVRVFSGASGAPLLALAGAGPGEAFGSAVLLVADLDGDQRADVVAGGAFEAGASGAAGIARAHSSRSGRELRAWRGRSGGDRFGTALASAEDRDGDGLPELLAGAPKDDAPAIDGGAGFVLSTRGTAPLAYCTAKLSSAGCTPALRGEGFASAGGVAELRLRAAGVLPQKPGLFLFARARAATPFLGGTLCLAPPVQRSPALRSDAAAAPCSAALAWTLDAGAIAAFGWPPGEVLDAQAWFRDPQHPDGTASGLSDALEFCVWQ